MSLLFLNPWLWLGALAVAAPLWLHLRRKQETNLLQFSALRFLEDAPEPRGGARQLRDVLLFLMRALAVLLLAGAFAWPYLAGQEPLVVEESRVYILDNTLSHQAEGGFAAARDRIQNDLAAAGPEVQIAVIELTGQPRVLAGFADDRALARQRLEELAPSAQRGSYLAAFRQANSLLSSSLGGRKRIILCADNQENQWTENVNTPPFLEEVQVDLPKPASAQAANLALAEPRLQRIFLGDKSLLNCTVKLLHTGPAQTAQVTMRANDQTILSRAVDLVEQPETILLQAQWEADPALWLRGEVSVEGQPDTLAGDNRAYFALPPVREGRVALLATSPYLRLALSPEVMRGHWTTRLLDPAKLADEVAAGKDEEVLILESGYLQSPHARELVSRYLQNGRGALLLVNRLSPAANGMLRELGFVVKDPPGSAQPAAERLQFFFSNHPVFHPFLSPDYGNLLEVTVRRHEQIEALEAVPLVFSSSGDPLFFEGTRFRGRLFVAGFGLDREQTTWPTHVTFIPFLDLCLQAARAEDVTLDGYEPGQAAVVPFPVDSAVREVVLRDSLTELQRIPVIEGKAQLFMPGQPGVYTLSWDNAAAPEKIFSINPSPKESRLSYVESPPALDLWQADRDSEISRPLPPPKPALISLNAILQQRIWWWLLLAAGAALLLETGWAMARKGLS